MFTYLLTYLHQNAFGYSDGFMPNFYVKFLTKLTSNRKTGHMEHIITLRLHVQLVELGLELTGSV